MGAQSALSFFYVERTYMNCIHMFLEIDTTLATPFDTSFSSVFLRALLAQVQRQIDANLKKWRSYFDLYDPFLCSLIRSISFVLLGIDSMFQVMLDLSQDLHGVSRRSPGRSRTQGSMETLGEQTPFSIKERLPIFSCLGLVPQAREMMRCHPGDSRARPILVQTICLENKAAAGIFISI